MLGLEPQGQEDAGEQQDDEAPQRDLAEHERPVVGEDLADLLLRRAWRGRGGRRPRSAARADLARLLGRGRGRRRCSSATLLVSMLMRVTLPEARSDRFGEVALRDQVALVVHRRAAAGAAAGPPGRRSPCRVGEVEGRLVARAQQVVGGALVQRDRAARRGCRSWSSRGCRRRAQFSRPAPGVISSGSIRTRMTAALDFAIWSSTPSSSGSPSSSVSKSALGLGVDQVADLRGRRAGSGCRRRRGRRACPRLPDRCCVELVAGQRAEVAQQRRRRGRPSRPSAPSSELRISGRRPMPDSSTPALSAVDGASSRSSSVERDGVAHLDDLVVGHQLAGPLDRRRCR